MNIIIKLKFNIHLIYCIIGLLLFQSNLAAAECRVFALNEEHNTVMSRVEEAETSLSILKSDLEAEKTSKKQETELLARKVEPIYLISLISQS